VVYNKYSHFEQNSICKVTITNKTTLQSKDKKKGKKKGKEKEEETVETSPWYGRS
jgi:hypothetical protein